MTPYKEFVVEDDGSDDALMIQAASIEEAREVAEEKFKASFCEPYGKLIVRLPNYGPAVVRYGHDE